MTLLDSDEILVREQSYFDREAIGLASEALRIPPDQIDRYRRARPSPWNIPKDALFAHLGSLAGQRVLDYGCGHGENACLLAACGAQVTAFDLSPHAIATAQRRAELHGFADRIQFQVSRAGETEYPSSHFDVVIGFDILHHLHTDLAAVYAEIDRLLKPSGRTCFIEPVANSPLLRAWRRRIPVEVVATPDERQLVYRDFDLLQRHFSQMQCSHFYCLERLHRVFGRSVRLPLRWLDHQAQRFLPALRGLYGYVLVTASR